MLVGSDGILEPRVVTDVNQIIRYRQGMAHITAKCRLEANRYPGAVFAGEERRLHRIAARKIAVRDVHILLEDA